MAISPVEILYVDHQRLHSYVDQITTSPLDSAPRGSLKARISTAGASVEAHLDQQTWQRRTIDSIRLLERHLEKNDLLDSRRFTTSPDWVRETRTAYKVHVPASSSAITQRHCLTFWYSPPSHDRDVDGFDPLGALCLMEDGRLHDATRAPVAGYADASTFSVLNALLGDVHADPDNPNRLIMHTESDLKILGYCYEFAANPREVLVQWGCTVGDPRRVQTLYRVRRGGLDRNSGTWSTYAYAIWICEADSRH